MFYRRIRLTILASSFTLFLLSPFPAFPQEHGHQAVEGAAQEEAHGGDSLTYWKWANFALLAGGLGFVLAKKGGAFFNSRTDEIRKGIDQAAKMKAEAEHRYAEMDKRLAGIEAEVKTLRASAAEETAAEGERVRQETERDLKKVQAQAERDIEAAGKAARQELRAYSAELAVELAEKKIRERLTPDVQDGLVKSMLANLNGKGAK